MGFIKDDSTADEYETLWEYGNDSGAGFDFFGSIKNSGANSMTVRLTVGDIFGNTDQNATPVLAGDMWDFRSVVTGMFGSAMPMARFSIEIKSTVAGLPTTYQGRIPLP